MADDCGGGDWRTRERKQESEVPTFSLLQCLDRSTLHVKRRACDALSRIYEIASILPYPFAFLLSSFAFERSGAACHLKLFCELLIFPFILCYNGIY